MSEDDKKIFPLLPLRFRLFVKLYHMEREGKKQDFIEALERNYHQSHRDFINNMIETGVLEPSRMILEFGKYTQGYIINKEKMLQIMDENLDEETKDMFQDMIDKNFMVFRL
jgi:hypothetical protein